MGTALCAMCDLAERGIKPTEQQLAEYNASKMGRRGSVSFLRIPPMSEMVDATKFTLRTLGQSLITRAMAPLRAEKPKQPSQKASERKRRGRLFENEDLQALGSMQDVDDALRKAKENAER